MKLHPVFTLFLSQHDLFPDFFITLKKIGNPYFINKGTLSKGKIKINNNENRRDTIRTTC